VAAAVTGTRWGARDVTGWLGFVVYSESPGMRYLEWVDAERVREAPVVVRRQQEHASRGPAWSRQTQ
jgi:hypothetical protein